MRRANGDASRPGAGLGLALLATALLAGRLAEGDLIGDPVIYAAVAKSMLVRGEWTTLYLAGQPFFDKPPLVVWLAALAFKLFGVSTWSARLPGVALGIAACLVLWRLGAFLFDERVGLAAGAILALTPGFVRFGSTLLLDTALALGALAGLLATARAFARGGRGLWQAGVWFGVAFLGKGALALGAPAVLAAYWLATPGDRRPPLGVLVVAPSVSAVASCSRAMGLGRSRDLLGRNAPLAPPAPSRRHGCRGDGARARARPARGTPRRLSLEARGDPGALRLLRRSRGRAHGRRSGRAGPPRGRHAGGDRAARRARARGRRPLRGAPPLARLRRLPRALTRSVSRDGGAGRRGRRLRFDSAPPWPGASIGRRPRRLIGAPTAPPPPRCAIRPRARAARRRRHAESKPAMGFRRPVRRAPNARRGPGPRRRRPNPGRA